MDLARARDRGAAIHRVATTPEAVPPRRIDGAAAIGRALREGATNTWPRSIEYSERRAALRVPSARELWMGRSLRSLYVNCNRDNSVTSDLFRCARQVASPGGDASSWRPCRGLTVRAPTRFSCRSCQLRRIFPVQFRQFLCYICRPKRHPRRRKAGNGRCGQARAGGWAAQNASGHRRIRRATHGPHPARSLRHCARRATNGGRVRLTSWW
jgi:hypothetical protein